MYFFLMVGGVRTERMWCPVAAGRIGARLQPARMAFISVLNVLKNVLKNVFFLVF